MTLVVDHLSKRFGSVVALDDLAFEVPQGQVFGFLGANGAGKTTTMRIALGVLEPDAGRVTWRGVESHRLPRSTWGYLPEERGLYPRMRVLEQLVFFAGLHGVPADRARRVAMDWLRRFRAEDLADRRAEQLSKGNQQKIQFIAAVLHDPQVLLMDEPFTGLDPVNVMLLREAFLELRDRGRTVVFSTHQMEVAEALCESVAIVDRGRVVVGGPIREVRRATGRRMVRISVADDHRLPWLADRAGDADDPGGHGPLDGRARRRARAGGGPRRGRRRRRQGRPLRDRRPQPRAGVHRLRRPPGRRGDPPGPGRRRGGGAEAPRLRTPPRREPPRPRTRRDQQPARRAARAARGHAGELERHQRRARRPPRVHRARAVPGLRVLDAAADRPGRGGRADPARRPAPRSGHGDPGRRRRRRRGAGGTRASRSWTARSTRRSRAATRARAKFDFEPRTDAAATAEEVRNGVLAGAILDQPEARRAASTSRC